MTKKIILILFLFSAFIQAQKIGCQAGKSNLLPPPYYCAENVRSDTFDILKYTISLEIGNTFTPQIKGNTSIEFQPKMNGRTYIRLDLLKLIVDSVKESNTLLTYAYNDTILKVNFTAPKNAFQTSTITVYYKGQPQGDPSGWGGFYFDNNGGNQYAYNLGVGFGAKPHNYGRVWFPCFDNFVEHSKYEFRITSDTARRAYCNGSLTSDVINLPNRTRTWVLNDEIPTYLASVSLAKYKQVNWTANTLSGPKPIKLAAVAADTTGIKNGFVNLQSCITGFENYYGPYKWERFGYCLVPFNSGAMEHATNISYPRAAIGSLAYEAELMAHELSHHWWGDLITCETAEDMWINEGMASYSAYLFQEWKYGKATYLNSVKTTHEDLVHQLHKKEGGFRAISGIPHTLTYGDHVYKKGADVAHTLRSYMGDTDYFNACKYLMIQKEHQNVNSNELRDLFQTSSGKNLTDFFNNWVFNGGWPHFSIDSVKYVQTGTTYNAIVSIKQKIFGAPALFTNVPLELSFFKSDWSRSIQTVTMSGATANYTVSVPFNPIYCALNYDSKISDATSFDTKVIKNPGNVNYTLSKVFLSVESQGSDSSLVRVIHNFVKPDPFKSNPKNHKLSNQHYWKVEGIFSPGFISKAKFNYDGTKSIGGTYAYLDTMLTIVNGDSVRLFYRADASADWQLVMDVFKFQSGPKTGFIEINYLKPGEYTFGNSTDTTNIVNVKEGFSLNDKIKIYPNPAKQYFKIDMGVEPTSSYLISILDMEGRLISQRSTKEKMVSESITDHPKGSYLVKIESENKLIYCKKLIIE